MAEDGVVKARAERYLKETPASSERHRMDCAARVELDPAIAGRTEEGGAKAG